MQYADVNGERCEAAHGQHAVCPLCGTQVIAKCGQLVVHHWAHVSNQECDPWWEPETEWHRHWKSFAAQTEVSIQNHRADIVTSTGLVVELQHSGISVDEIIERERCYGPNLRWLFDGRDIPVRAPNGEYLYHPIEPDTDRWITLPGEYGQHTWYFVDNNIGWSDDDLTARLYLRKKAAPSARSWEVVTFRWLYPRKHYAAPTRPVYIDLPGKFILKLGKLHLESGAPYGGWGHLIPRTVVEGWLK